MRFRSTRSLGEEAGFAEAVFQGLAPDGGLYHPIDEPDLKELFLGFSENHSFQDIAAEIGAALFPDEMSPSEARAIAEKAFPFSPGLRTLDETHSILELFHGPSCAFKDFGASYLATVMEHFLRGKKRRALILTATSGDTGSAVAQAFYRKENIDVVILYPSGRVSPSQEKQLTTLGENIHALEVRGSFDDCQRMVKEAFVDPGMQQAYPLTSANSINLGRLIPQSFYYVYAFSRIKARIDGELYFTVPSGNFGNLTAGLFAWRWGLPVTRFIAATNANDVVPQYLREGVYYPRPSVHTPANAMDVGNPSNFERMQALFHSDLERMRAMVYGDTVKDSEILETMAAYYRDRHLHLCPHTATGMLVSERFARGEMEGEGHIITLATAHPAKFSEVCLQATGSEPEVPGRLARWLERQKHATMVNPELGSLREYLEKNL